MLEQQPSRIDIKFLKQFPEFGKFPALRREENAQEAPADEGTTPEEALEGAYQRLRATIESELLQRVMTASPGFFERLVVKLLVSMGYGGSIADAGQAIGGSGDYQGRPLGSHSRTAGDTEVCRRTPRASCS